ncbi:MAG: hypothetical protein ACE5LU_04545 [Anaerolineae bacterium]
MRISISVPIGALLVAGIALSYPVAEAAPTYQRCNQVEITSPRPEAELRGFVTIEGSASIGEFQFYKVEYSTADQPDLWRAISQTYNRPIINGALDRWNTPALPDGEYNLKLTAVDVRGQEICRYLVRNLSIANTQPAATPTPEVPPTLPGPTPTPTPRATATPAPPTPTPTIVAIIPTRQPMLPELDTIRKTVRGAFDVARLQELFLLGAGTTTAVFVFLGLISLLRRLV